jgi:hypothetical protein
MVFVVNKSWNNLTAIWRWGPWSRETYDSELEIAATVRLESPWIPSCWYLSIEEIFMVVYSLRRCEIFSLRSFLGMQRGWSRMLTIQAHGQ